MYDEIDASTLVVIASMTENAHANTPGQTSAGCPQCTPTGCGQLDWALKVLAEHRAARAKFLGRDVRGGRDGG
ncbi:hypothetical protein [Micromonospora sediminicola]|uniref:hypothetical protein n=1 Tax=Micromonospora sediminicola TaxID=946078 RepID=UPI00378E178E